MFRFIFLCLFILIQINTLKAADDFSSKKHDVARKECTVETKFLPAKKIRSSSKYSALTTVDPKQHKTVMWFHGFPVEEEINLSICRVAQINPKNYTPKHKFSLREDGVLLDEKNEPKSHFCLSSAGYLPGERIRCYFASSNGNFVKEISLIPNPIAVRNGAGEPIIEAELISIKPTVYQVNVQGLNENEKFVFKSRSGVYITEISEVFTKDGVSFTYSPECKGKKGGESTVEIRRKSGKKYTLKFPWGTRLTAFLDKDKVFNER